ncbi:terminal nucleotidyltransferase 5C isoform X1 [Vespula squamosa]|uniref:Terminal nucleotidyltransferase 5C isoform X1 n=1 Tax=Vespula squamosa TaxID=30214 RepID=A0ABD1ZTK9_VESSQ
MNLTKMSSSSSSSSSSSRKSKNYQKKKKKEKEEKSSSSSSAASSSSSSSMSDIKKEEIKKLEVVVEKKKDEKMESTKKREETNQCIERVQIVPLMQNELFKQRTRILRTHELVSSINRYSCSVTFEKLSRSLKMSHAILLRQVPRLFSSNASSNVN